MTVKRIFLPGNISVKDIITIDEYKNEIMFSDYTTLENHTQQRLYVCSIWPEAMLQSERLKLIDDPKTSLKEKNNLLASLCKEELVQNWDKLIGLPVIDAHCDDESNPPFEGHTWEALGMVVGILQDMDTGETLVVIKFFDDGVKLYSNIYYYYYYFVL